MQWRRNYTRDGQKAPGWNTGDKVETQDTICVTAAEKMVIFAALQAYRSHPLVKGSVEVEALVKRFALLTGFDDES